MKEYKFKITNSIISLKIKAYSKEEAVEKIKYFYKNVTIDPKTNYVVII